LLRCNDFCFCEPAATAMLSGGLFVTHTMVRQARSKAAGALEPQFYALR
jgi:hypothetical protein